MTVTVKVFVPAGYLENALTTKYTATNCKAIIDNATLTNVSGGALTVDLHLVASGGSATAANKIIPARSIAAGETYRCPELVNKSLESGGFISAVASAATSIVIHINGREITS